MIKNIQITANPLEIADCRVHVTANNNGAECLFVGTVRDQTKGNRVTKLLFECYESMALKEMEKIAQLALNKYDISAIALHHRIGTLEVGDIPVIIAVGSAHRKAAFEACQFAIDTLKDTVPIWKKEFFEDGAIWVSAHP
ncbi:MAG: molybdopterin synthase catalytic subunit [Bacteroidia bacterium]